MKYPYLCHVPHGTFLSLLILLTAAISTTHADADADTSVPTLVSMSSDHAEAKQHIQSGIRDTLLGWDEQARQHFRAAVAADPQCALGWCGLMLTEGATAEAQNALGEIFASDYAGTPQEEALLSSWLAMIQGSRGRAGEEFAERSLQYRNDTLSACWAIYLLHDGYDNLSGKALPNQARALQMAQELYERRPEDALVSYLRGWVEASAPEPSETALTAAQQAANLLPEHPSAQLLYGHLLYRKGQLQQAIGYVHHAAELAAMARPFVPHGTNQQPETGSASLASAPLEVRAKLYESTLLWLNGQKKESLVLQSQLLRATAAVPREDSLLPGAVLLHWEARTLPLRLLLLSPELPTDKQVAAACKAALPALVETSDALLDFRDCLRFCLVARQRAAAGKGADAQRCITAAGGSLHRLEEARERCEGQGGYVLSAWERAREACQQALCAAKAATYSESSDIWLRCLEEQQRPATLLMPPVIPHKK